MARVRLRPGLHGQSDVLSGADHRLGAVFRDHALRLARHSSLLRHRGLYGRDAGQGTAALRLLRYSARCRNAGGVTGRARHAARLRHVLCGVRLRAVGADARSFDLVGDQPDQDAGSVRVRAVRYHADLLAPARPRSARFPRRLAAAALATGHRAAGDRRRRDHGAPSRHQRAAGQGRDVHRLLGVHDRRGRGDGPALRLSHPELRVQSADLLPGRDHGAARRDAAAVGAGARHRSPDPAVGVAAGAGTVLVQRDPRPHLHGHRLFSPARRHRPGGGCLGGVAPCDLAAARRHRARNRCLGVAVAADVVAARHRGFHRRSLGAAHPPPAERRPVMALLEVDGLTKAFGGLVAVSNMSLAVSPGEVLGLIGPNGSGKTTLLNLIAGTLRCDAGAIRIGGEDVTRLPNHLRVRRRINRTFQLVRMPPNLPAIVGVMAGVMYGAEPKPYKEAEYEAAGILGELNLLLKAGHRLDQLTYIEQKRVELARALATKPRVLLLDEWLSGLSPGELEGGMSVVWSLAAQGLAIILVEHVMTAVRALCSRVVVMNAGLKIAEGPPDDVLRNAEVIRAYLGDDDAAL